MLLHSFLHPSCTEQTYTESSDRIVDIFVFNIYHILTVHPPKKTPQKKKRVNFDAWNIVSGYDVCNLVVPYISSMRVHLVTPFILLALIIVAWGVVVIIGLLHSFDKCSCCCRRRYCVQNFNYESRHVVSYRAISISVCILRLMVPGIGARALRTWRCKEVEGGRQYMISDFRVECGNSEWTEAVFLATFIGAMWMLVTPLVTMGLLAKRSAKKCLCCKESANVHGLDAIEHQQSFGSLYLHIKRPYRVWWESCALFQRSCLTGLAVVVQPDSSVQLLLAVTLTVFWLCLTLELRPYNDRWNQELHVLSQLCIVMTFLFGFAIRADEKSLDMPLVAASLLLCNIAVLLMGLFLVANDLRPSLCVSGVGKLSKRGGKKITNTETGDLPEDGEMKVEAKEGGVTDGINGEKAAINSDDEGVDDGEDDTEDEGDENFDNGENGKERRETSRHVRRLMRRSTLQDERQKEAIKKKQNEQALRTQQRLMMRNKLKQSKCLEKVPGFEHLDAGAISKVVDRMEVEYHSEMNETICTQGEQADRLYVIMKGRVEIIINVDGVGAKKVREMGELEFFGENGLFEEGSSRGATVQSAGAVGKCTLLTLTRKSFRSLQTGGVITKKIVDTLEQQKKKYVEEDVNRKLGTGADLSRPPPPPKMLLPRDKDDDDDEDGGKEKGESAFVDEDGSHLV